MRGGSFNNDRTNARCAYRNRNTPDNMNNNIGFRMVSHDLCRSGKQSSRSRTRDDAKNSSQRSPFLTGGQI